MRVLLFLLKFELIQLGFLTETDVSEMILIVKSVEELLDVLVGQVLIDEAAVLSVNDEDDTLPLDVVVAEHVVDYVHILPLGLFKLLVCFLIFHIFPCCILLYLLLFVLRYDLLDVFEGLLSPEVD